MRKTNLSYCYLGKKPPSHDVMEGRSASGGVVPPFSTNTPRCSIPLLSAGFWVDSEGEKRRSEFSPRVTADEAKETDFSFLVKPAVN